MKIFYMYARPHSDKNKSGDFMRYLKAGGGFLFGGAAYVLIEILWRGYSHYSMFLAGGLGFLLIMAINRLVTPRAGYLFAAVLCALGITAVELVTGCIFNLWLGMKIWDYSNIPLNFKGQICELFSTVWIFLSLGALRLEKRLSGAVGGLLRRVKGARR